MISHFNQTIVIFDVEDQFDHIPKTTNKIH